MQTGSGIEPCQKLPPGEVKNETQNFDLFLTCLTKQGTFLFFQSSPGKNWRGELRATARFGPQSKSK